MSKSKSNPAVELGKRRALSLDAGHQQAAARARWANHQPCQCGKCPACYQRAYRAKRKVTAT
jgi:hypothetical protein